jgi:hypothetical protein
MKKGIITLSELRQISPIKAGKVITALNRNRVKKKNTKSQNLSADFSRNSITKHIIKSILNN